MFIFVFLLLNLSHEEFLEEMLMSGISLGSYKVDQGIRPPPVTFVIHPEQGRLAGGEANIKETVHFLPLLLLSASEQLSIECSVYS